MFYHGKKLFFGCYQTDKNGFSLVRFGIGISNVILKNFENCQWTWSFRVSFHNMNQDFKGNTVETADKSCTVPEATRITR